LYVNGVQLTEFDQRTNPSQNYESKINDTIDHTLGEEAIRDRYNYNGYMAEVNFIDGTALAPTDFGELDDNGVWRPKRYTGSYTGQSFYLKFDADDVGGDSSGLSNDFTPSASISTSGTGTDVLSDTPTTNWCTLNPLEINGTLSNGNLDYALNAAYGTRGTFFPSTGKWYFEAELTAGTNPSYVIFGIQRSSGSLGSYSGGVAIPDGYGYLGFGTKMDGSSGSSYGDSFTTNDVIGVAYDLDAGKVWFSKNGTWQNSGDPAAGTGEAFSSITAGGYAPFAANETTSNNDHTGILNFGQRAFAYTPPTDFLPLNTSNLSAPTVKDGSDYFNTVLYTGNGTDNHTITGVGFQPSFTWIKTRSVADNHVLHDEVRGANRQLFTNSTDFEFTATTLLKSFDSDGFTLGTDSGANGLSRTFVAWNWLAGGSTSTNTDGSITSTVSANPSAGFSIGTYTADGTNTNKTVGHGLGVAPEFIIVKNRDTTGRHWLIWHKDFNDNDKAALFTADAPADNRFGPSAPTSTVFGLYGGQGNYNSDDHVFYAWTGVEGYSKISSWTGNGNPDGVYIHCGFSPSFIMFKRTDTTDNWVIFDTARTPNNVVQYGLFPDLSLQENYSANYSTDILSNGFKLRTQYFHNISGGNYVFIAFASNPFGGSGVNPATAR
jgi:hypothetical protein